MVVPPKADISESARELLMKAAKRLFATKGFEGTSVREVAEEAGVNLALVSYYFGGKEGLFKTCLEDFGKGKLALFQQLLIPPKSQEEFRVRLQMFAETILNSFISEPDVSAMLHRECESNVERVEDIFKNTFLKVIETFQSFLRAAQKSNIVRSDLDPHVVTTLLFGMLIHQSRIDKIQERFFKMTIRDSKHRDKVLKNFLQVALDGVLTKGPTK